MDHKAFLKSLSPDQRRRLTERSDLRGLLHLLGHVGLILLFGLYVALTLPYWPFVMVPLGISLIFLFTLMHETVHFTPFRSTWLNLVICAVCGVILGLGPTWFRYFHLAHHRFTQDPENDPELASPKPDTRAALLWHLTGLPMWRYQALTLAKNAFGDPSAPYLPDRRTSHVKWEARLMIALYTAFLVAALWFGWAWVFWLWVCPLLLGQPFLRAYLLAEHADCEHGANMFANTRTVFTSAPVRFLAWNMPFHAEHHAYPNVPFHALPRLHELSKTHLRETADGYVAFNRNFAKTVSNARE